MSKTSLTYLLQMLDRYPMTLEVKGSYAALVAKKIIVTTNIHPALWYDYSRREEQYKALQRRFTKIVTFVGKLSLQVSHKVFFGEWFEGCDEAAIFARADPDATVTLESDEYSDSELSEVFDDPMPQAQPLAQSETWDLSDTEFV